MLLARAFSLELSDPFHCREKIEFPLLVVKPIEKKCSNNKSEHSSDP